MVSVFKKYKRNKKSFLLKAIALTAALCMCVTASGCGDKTKDNTSSELVQSIAGAAESVETKDAASASGEKTESKAESKTDSKTESKAESKSESKASSKSESKAESKTESKSASKTESKAQSNSETSVEVKPESKASPSADSKADNKSEVKKTDGFSKGQTIVLDIRFGNININGDAAKIGAYDYWIEYDASALEYVESVEQTKSDLQLVNDDEVGKLKIAHIAAMGFKDDYSGKKKSTYKVYFTAKKDMKDVKEMGITCKCPSLTAVSMDGKDTFTLISTKTPQDRYSEYSITAE